MVEQRGRYVWVLLRLGIGWILLWAFLDKLFGLGFATSSAKSWLAGGSPTAGFLKSATYGPLKEIFQNLAQNAAVDWLFMMGLLLIGLALILGIGVRIAAISGTVLMSLMWLAALPPKNNPFLDDHIIYILVLVGLARVNAGQWFGLGKWWSQTGLVKKFQLLQ